MKTVADLVEAVKKARDALSYVIPKITEARALKEDKSYEHHHWAQFLKSIDLKVLEEALDATREVAHLDHIDPAGVCIKKSVESINSKTVGDLIELLKTLPAETPLESQEEGRKAGLSELEWLHVLLATTPILLKRLDGLVSAARTAIDGVDRQCAVDAITRFDNETRRYRRSLKLEPSHTRRWARRIAERMEMEGWPDRKVREESAIVENLLQALRYAAINLADARASHERGDDSRWISFLQCADLEMLNKVVQDAEDVGHLDRSLDLTYDPQVDAAYIYFGERAHVGKRAGGAGRTVDVHGDMNVMLDYDAAGILRGIEVMGASRRLAPELLALTQSRKSIDE